MGQQDIDEVHTTIMTTLSPDIKGHDQQIESPPTILSCSSAEIEAIIQNHVHISPCYLLHHLLHLCNVICHVSL